MGRKKPVILGDHLQFSKQGDAVLFFQTMLYKYEENHPIDDKSDSDALLLLLQRHPDALQKIGAGVQYFFRGAGDYGTSCFWIRRVDGSEENFSFRKSITG